MKYCLSWFLIIFSNNYQHRLLFKILFLDHIFPKVLKYLTENLYFPSPPPPPPPPHFFFGFLGTDLLPLGHSKMCLPVALCCLIVRGLDLELVSKRLIYLQIDEQETYLSADKNTRVVLESYHSWKGIPAIILVVWTFMRLLGFICCKRYVFRVGKKIKKVKCLLNMQPFFHILPH